MTTKNTEILSLFEIGDMVFGISDYFIDDILVGIIIKKKKLMGFYCYKIQWVLDGSLNNIPDIEPEWLKEKELSLYKESIKV